MYTYITNKYNMYGTYYCEITLRTQNFDAALNIPPSKEEITDEDINNYIRDNIDQINNNVFRFQESITYTSLYEILKTKIKYFDIFGIEIEDLPEEL